MKVPGPAPQDLRGRAIRLLEAEFRLRFEPRERRLICEEAFGDDRPKDLDSVTLHSPLPVFAADVVDRLLHHGCMARGQHALSRLIRHLAALHSRPANPDYYDLPRDLDSQCSLPTRQEEQAYLARLRIDAERYVCRYSPLEGLFQPKSAPPFAAGLHTLWNDEFEIASIRHEPQPLAANCAAPPPQSLSHLLDYFGKLDQAAVLGEPGSGKSTMLWRYAANLAFEAQHDPSKPIPLLARLGNWTGEESFYGFLVASIPEIGWAAQTMAASGRLVVLLDGLNEMPTARRDEKAKEIRDLLGNIPKLIVTCRVQDYAGGLALPLDKLTLQPLSPPRILAAVSQWVTSKQQSVELAERFFWQLSGDTGLVDDLADWRAKGKCEESFWTDSKRYRLKLFHEDPRRLLKLAANPFLLSMLFRLWWLGNGLLPPNRGGLFRDFIYHLLKRAGLAPKGIPNANGEQLLAGLSELAWTMQHARVLDGLDFGVLTVVPGENAKSIVGDEVLLKCAIDSTLLEGESELRFRHQLLQEYFTARALQARMAGTKAAELWPVARWWERSGWEETAVLLTGFSGEDGTPVIRWLRDAQPEVAAQCITESGAKISDEAELKRELYGAWMPRLLTESSPEARAALGRALGRLELDDRPGIGLTKGDIPDIEWVEIPAGSFLYGEERERRWLEGFAMSRYLVTNVQYRAFLKSPDGYGDDQWWVGLEGAERTPAEPSWGESNHPRETVSWFEATAFCRWLSQKLGKEVSLPKEEQWERAARGEEGNLYPWGDEYVPGYANVNEVYDKTRPHYLRRTSAVGIYPKGEAEAGGTGIMDLSGNVWEWCQDEHEIEKESRVLRGGVWGEDAQFARTDFRFFSQPDVRIDYFGFRLVCSSPILR